MRLRVLDNYALTTEDKAELLRVLDIRGEEIQLTDIWRAMDKVFTEYDCSSYIIDDTSYGKFYSHPIWVLNGIFSENDKTSLEIRKHIAEFAQDLKLGSILDYGGGFGSLAKIITSLSSAATVDIYEPHPSRLAKKEIGFLENARFISKIEGKYDAIVCLDVFEHIADPVGRLFTLRQYMKDGAYLVVGNSFYPSIKCHLPTTFHLRTSFSLIAKAMGLERDKRRARSYVEIYRYSKSAGDRVTAKTIRLLEFLSRTQYWLIPGRGRVQIFMSSPAHYSIEIVKRFIKSIKRSKPS